MPNRAENPVQCQNSHFYTEKVCSRGSLPGRTASAPDGKRDFAEFSDFDQLQLKV